MSASAEMPYFIRPSVNLNDDAKRAAYQRATLDINATLDGEDNATLKMATINALLKSHLPYYYWVGFYCVQDGRLSVGPYQGTMGCLHINFDRGVCGRAARERTTQIVGDVHALAQGKEHIACDPNSASEIVVPVFNQEGDLIAVLDVDSTQQHSFNAIDQTYLEQIVHDHFGKHPLREFSYHDHK
ncbi:MAG TPA: GAF domain-containing protein [Saprospiraceae bacterium]|nr:GAF domain-containing protein [Saprospiraceae bacterium]